MTSRSPLLRAALAGGLAVAVGIVLWLGWGRGGTSEAASDGPWRFRPAHGATVGYRFRLQGQMDADTSVLLASGKARPAPRKPSPAHHSLALAGTLQLRYFQTSATRYRVAARLRGATLRDNAKAASLVGLTNTLFSFSMSTTGYFSRFRFVAGVPTITRTLLRTLLAALQVGLPQKRKSRWATYEVDPTGRYRARYVVVTLDRAQGRATVTKQKLAYLSTRVAHTALASRAGRVAIIPGPERATVVLPLAGDLPLRYHARGSSRARLGTKTWARSQSRFTAHRVRITDTKGLPGSLAALEDALASNRLLVATQDRPDPRFDRLQPARGLGGALDAYLRMLAAGESSRLAEQYLKDYLRRHPAACHDLVDLLDRGRKGIGFKQELVLWRLLAETGHPEAQRALLSAVRDPDRAELTHYRALAVLHDIQAPTAEMTRALWAHFEVLRASPRAGDRPLRTMTLLALGTLAGRPGASKILRAEMLGRLTDALAAAPLPEQRAAFLDALGNLGQPDILPAVEPYLTAEAPEVRQTAYEALRRIDPPRALETFTRYYEAEASESVRGAALRALAQMKPTRRAMDWVQNELATEQSPELQVALAAILGNGLKRFPDNARALRALLAQNPPIEVKRTIYHYIAPAR